MFLVIVKYIILTSDTLELVQYGVIFLINLTVKRLDCELMPSLRENDLESASSIICFVRIATKILNTQRKLLPCISYVLFFLLEVCKCNSTTVRRNLSYTTECPC